MKVVGKLDWELGGFLEGFILEIMVLSLIDNCVLVLEKLILLD